MEGTHMKKGILKRVWILILIAVMVLPPLRIAHAAGSSSYYTKIYVHKNPTKMEYEVGESFDATGMQIYGDCYNPDNGSTQTYSLGLSSLVVSPSKFTKAGKITVTLTLTVKTTKTAMGQLSCKLTVDVYDSTEGDPPTYWTKKITADAKKTVYKVGESFDKAGLKVWAYSEGYYPPEDEKWDCTKYVTKISPSKFKKAGEQYVTITANLTAEHGTKDFTYKIKVKVYDSIEITKHPGGETVEEGGSCAFTVKATNVETYSWFFVSDNVVIPVKEKDDYFPGLKYSGDHSKKLKLSNIPASLDGWSVMCEFSNELETVESDTAFIKVLKKGSATEAPTDPPTKAPDQSAESGPTPTPEPTAEPTETPEPEHVHSFDGIYRFDSKQHWLECSCGERKNTADHIVTEWTEILKPSKDAPGIRSGYCVVCGAKVTESVPYEGFSFDGDLKTWALYGGIGLAGIAGIGCVIAGVALNAKKKKAAKHKHHKEEMLDEEE